MVRAQNIDVSVVYQRDHNIRYQEWDPPLDGSESPAVTEDAYQRYIEAVTDQRIALIVHVGDSFDFKGASHIRIIWSIDNHSYTSTFAEKDARGKHVFDSGVSQVGIGWSLCGFFFKALIMDENITLDRDEMAQACQEHGKVVVSVERGTVKESHRPEKPQWYDGYDPPDATRTSKEVIKKHHVSHSVGRIALEPVTQPKYASSKEWKPQRKRSHKIPTFTIRYRSAWALEMLKIIPPRPLEIGDNDVDGNGDDLALRAAHLVHGAGGDEPSSAGQHSGKRSAGDSDLELLPSPPKRQRNEAVSQLSRPSGPGQWAFCSKENKDHAALNGAEAYGLPRGGAPTAEQIWAQREATEQHHREAAWEIDIEWIPSAATATHDNDGANRDSRASDVTATPTSADHREESQLIYTVSSGDESSDETESSDDTESSDEAEASDLAETSDAAEHVDAARRSDTIYLANVVEETSLASDADRAGNLATSDKAQLEAEIAHLQAELEKINQGEAEQRKKDMIARLNGTMWAGK